jgi:uncharacterized membrane protein
MEENMASNLIRYLPYLLINIGGLVFALLNWRKHPRLSGLVIVAVAFSIAQTAVILFVLPMFQAFLYKPEWMWVQSVLTLFGVGSHLLMMVAVFYGFHAGAAARKE